MLCYNFKFKGGVTKPHFWSAEKMLVFVVIGGKDVPLYQLVKEGLITQIEDESYQSHYDTIKLFVSTETTRFGSASKLSHNFYIRLLKNDIAPLVVIKALKEKEAPSFSFSGQFRFLKKGEVRSLLTDPVSLRYFKHQSSLPKRKLLEMVTVNRDHLKRGIRAIKFNLKKEQK